MRHITFTIPLPPTHCKPGSMGHWRPKARAVKEYREHAKIACLAAMGRERPSFAKAVIEYEFFLAKRPGDGRYRPRDEDNARAAMKAAQDGFVEARIVPGDTAGILRVAEPRFYRTLPEHGRKAEVLVTIREAL